jgi:hypothetical protein
MIKKKPRPEKSLPPRAGGTTVPPFRLGTPREACTYGRFSHTTLYDFINEGKVDAYKRGKSTLVDLDSIDRMHAALPKIRPKTKPQGNAAR